MARAQHNMTAIAEILNLALGGVDPPFNPYLDDISFLIATYIFEDVGVTAYLARPSDRPSLVMGSRQYVGLDVALKAVEGIESLCRWTTRWSTDWSELHLARARQHRELPSHGRLAPERPSCCRRPPPLQSVN